MIAMDWYSWLSKTNLDPSVVYEYGRMFTHNELQRSDIVYFNHEFLQSMGISIAKHRLEILKLVRKQQGGSNSLSKLISAIYRTKNLFTKRIGRCVSHKGSVHLPRPEPSPCHPHWPSCDKEEKATRTMRSGPLYRRGQERYVSPQRFLSVSGPLERKVQENVMLSYGSPMGARPGSDVSGPLDDLGMSPRMGIPCSEVKMTSEDGFPSLWSLMFQNMKPT